LWPLLKLSREMIAHTHKTEQALLRSLERDPLLIARVERLMTIPAVGPVTALTWVREMGGSRTIAAARCLYRTLCRCLASSVDRKVFAALTIRTVAICGPAAVALSEIAADAARTRIVLVPKTFMLLLLVILTQPV
jgi:hypothetical protein